MEVHIENQSENAKCGKTIDEVRLQEAQEYGAKILRATNFFRGLTLTRNVNDIQATVRIISFLTLLNTTLATRTPDHTPPIIST